MKILYFFISWSKIQQTRDFNTVFLSFSKCIKFNKIIINSGHNCLDGEMYLPQKCQPGEYQPDEGQTSCISCPEGYYCDVAGIDDIATDLPECDGGYQCDTGSISRGQKICEAGSYRPKGESDTDGNLIWECQDCPATYYCPNKAGFYILQ